MLKNFSIENWLTLTSLVFVAISGIFIFWQWRNSIKIKRAEFINQILEKLRFDEGLTKTMYMIDYNQCWYDKSFHGSGIEPSVDKFFSYVDYICYLKAKGVISKTEFKIFQYEIHRVCVSESTSVYLWNLYHFSKKNKTNCTFQCLIDYGIDCGLFPGDFKKNTSLYFKTLDW